jgi:hypothetical protein
MALALSPCRGLLLTQRKFSHSSGKENLVSGAARRLFADGRLMPAKPGAAASVNSATLTGINAHRGAVVDSALRDGLTSSTGAFR